MLRANYLARKERKILCMRSSKTVGGIVKDWRISRGLKTPGDLARVLKMPGNRGRMNIDNLEKGRTTQPYFIHELALLMGYSNAQELLSLQDPPQTEFNAESRAGEAVLGSSDELSFAYSGSPKHSRGAPVTGVARIGEDGYFEQVPFDGKESDGWVPALTDRPAYALRIKGDGLSPVIDSGQYLLVLPGSEPHPGERIVVAFKDGRRAIMKLLYQRADSLAVSRLGDGAQQTIEREAVAYVHAVFGTVEASHWKPDDQ
jgi:phage repressor protein C with HTH and peptisase S24 domain